MANIWQIMSIRIYLAGRVALEVDGRVLIDQQQFRGRQGRLLFAYLVSERTRPVSREELSSVLWTEGMPTAWEVAVSALISKLDKLISSDVLQVERVSLDRRFGQYQLLLPTDVWIDMETSASAIDRAESALRNGNSGGILGPATVAASIARRPFLPGVKGDWVVSQQRRLERQLIRALNCLSHMWLSEAEPGLAVETAIQAIALDPFRESSYRLLMRAYDGTGNRAQAVRVYHRLRDLLADDLGTDPSEETQALYLELLD